MGEIKKKDAKKKVLVADKLSPADLALRRATLEDLALECDGLLEDHELLFKKLLKKFS